ncbi:hypothetical protein BH11ACT5_BH11ACT5_16370 [soil metagenome]
MNTTAQRGAKVIALTIGAGVIAVIVGGVLVTGLA